MKRSKSSQNWLQQHFNDPYVKQAHSQGWRSRAVFKLQEIDRKYDLIKPNQKIVDLGAAPGGWSQYVTDKTQGRAQIYALDCLEMDPLPHVSFLQGDFTQNDTLNTLEDYLNHETIDLLLSDMAPNLSGDRTIDQPRVMHLTELAYDFAQAYLKQDADMLIKVFQGRDFDQFLATLKQAFQKVKVVKPKASNQHSTEVYLLCRGFK